MENRSEFEDELVFATMCSAANREDSRAFIKAALALRAWYRHEALSHKPEMLIQHTADVFEVYGGTRVERLHTGELKVIRDGHEQSPHFFLAPNLARYLASAARESIACDYRYKAKGVIRRLGLPEKLAASMCHVIDDADAYLTTNLNVNWWRRKCSFADDTRVIGKLLWETGIFDREAFSMATRVAGLQFPLDVYNLTVLNKEALAARISEAPNMIPWLLSEGYADRTLLVHETVWQEMKHKFLQAGGTAQTWRWLCKQGNTWFRQLSCTAWTCKALNEIAQLQLGKVPYHDGLVSKVRGSTEYPADVRAKYLDVFKAAMVANKKRKLKVADFEDYNLIFDYIDYVEAATTRGATWASLMRKQQAWHVEEVHKAAERRKILNICLSWQPIVPTLQAGALTAASLDNSDDLWEEGHPSAMSHCVGQYDEACFENKSRIYSIRRDGVRVATMELRIIAGKMSIGQLYGRRNTKVKDKDVISFSKRILAACKRSRVPDCAENRVLREAMPPDHPQYVAPQYEPPRQRYFAVPVDEADLDAIPF
jgi:hypothetical protein